MPEYSTHKSFAAELDLRDPLARYRGRFHLPRYNHDNEYIYFCGNSLGLQPRKAKEYVEQELDDWAGLGVQGHVSAKNPWVPYHEFLAGQTARLVGAKPFEVVVMNSLTVNLHLMMVSFYRPTKERHKIVIESNAFPSDQYAVESQVRFHGFSPSEAVVELQPRSGDAVIRTENIEDLLRREGHTIALVMLGGVNYYTGQAFEIERVTRAGHAAGCTVGFDLAHAAGNLVLKVHEWNVDFAVWCSYKYLNGGPGSIGGCYVHERHGLDFTRPRFAGWWGHNKEERFLMRPEFEPIPGAEGWQLSNPSILPMAALRASMEIFDEAGMEALRKKGDMLTGYMEFLLDQHANSRFSIITPRDQKQRGSQLSIRISGGKRVYEELTKKGVICDWREPDVIRVAPVPLYNTFTEVYHFAELFAAAVS